MLGQAERLVELKHLFNKDQAEDNSKKVFAFTSGKGGTGKTLLSLNIAYELSCMGKKVVYADLDFNLANAHLMLNINPANTLSHYFTHRKLLSDVIYAYSKNFHLVFGDSGKTGFPELTDMNISSLVAELKNHDYDIIILDLAAGAGKSITEILLHADFAVVVATTEPTAVMDAYAITKLMKFEKLACQPYIIMNKCRSSEDGAYAYNNLNSASKHFLKTPVNLLNYISFSSEAYDSVFSQNLISVLNPAAPVTAQIRHSAKRIAEIAQLANNLQPAKTNL